jgi:hypothetical protein
MQLDLDRADQIPDLLNDGLFVVREGDRWLCGDHVLLCLDPTRNVFTSSKRAIMAFVDFTLALAVVPDEKFFDFFLRILSENLVEQLRPGAIVYLSPDCRYPSNTITSVLGERRDLITWVRPEPVSTKLYRQRQITYIGVYVPGAKAPIRADQLTERSRTRSNVWEYDDGDGPEPSPLVLAKPVALIVDALKDSTKPGDIVLDPFALLGTTMIAAELTGCRARLMERSPMFCDAIVRRWQLVTGVPARLGTSDGPTYDEVAEKRGRIGSLSAKLELLLPPIPRDV